MRPVSLSVIVPSALSAKRAFQQAVVSKAQPLAQASVPPAKPWVTQVSPFRLPWSQFSTPSIVPLPHMPGQPASGPPASAAATTSLLPGDERLHRRLIALARTDSRARVRLRLAPL